MEAKIRALRRRREIFAGNDPRIFRVAEKLGFSCIFCVFLGGSELRIQGRLKKGTFRLEGEEGSGLYSPKFCVASVSRMTARGKESSLRDRRKDGPQKTLRTPKRDDASILAGERPKTAVEMHRPRMPEVKEFVATAEKMLVAGFFRMDEMVDTSSYERAQL